MMRWPRLEHRFVQFIPERLEPGVLYVSMEYATATHSCCCGCGEEVVTPFTPVGWRMTFDGETVSIWPSVGSWTLRCRSHYVIDQSSAVTAPPWSDTQVEAERRRDKAAREHHFGKPVVADVEIRVPAAPPPTTKAHGWVARLWRRIFGAK